MNWAERATKLWSFLEAGFWWVIPDAWLVGICAVYPDQAKRLTRACWTSSFLGVMVCWQLCCWQPDLMQKVIYGLPFTLPEMGRWIAQRHEQFGVWLSLYQPFSNAPVKVWVLEGSTRLHWNGLVFVVLVTASRALRMSLAARLGAWVGRRIPDWAWRHSRWMLAGYGLLVLYLLWWTSESFRA